MKENPVPEYNVHHTGYVSHVETVEADSPEEAIAAAQEGWVSLCHQCTREWDSAGDSEVFTVTDAAGETVWEQAPAPQPVVDREAVRAVIRTHISVNFGTFNGVIDACTDAVLALLNGAES
jgi:hypothetical protein